MNQENTKTFRREKSARNTIVSSTREFWNLRSKTKSWNFYEVRWRPYSPKESFKKTLLPTWQMLVSIGHFSFLMALIRMVEFQNDRSTSHPDGDHQGQNNHQGHAGYCLAILATDKEGSGSIGNISRNQGRENGQHKDHDRRLENDT